MDGVFNEPGVPRKMEIVQTVSALRRTKFCNVDIIAAASFRNRMQGLMDVGDKMDQEFEGLNAIGLRFIFVGQDSLEDFDSIHHAVVMVGFRFWMIFIGVVAIPLL